MNLPHLAQQETHKPVTRTGLGPKSMRALSRPIMPRGRQTTPVIHTNYRTGAFDEMAQMPDPSASWRTLETQRKYLLNMNYPALVQIALDLSPQVNKGLFDFLRFCNPGIFVDGEPRAVEGALQFQALLGDYYGSFNSHLDSIWSGIFVHGGAFLELVLRRGAREPLDLPALNPNLAKFRRIRHPERGYVWQLGQDDGLGGHRPLDKTRLVKYLGFDRLVDQPYGRPLVGPSVHASLFLLGLIQDLRRAVANQGLSRLDYELQAEELLALIDRNPDIAGDDEATAQFIEDQITAIRDVLSNLEPDSDFIHLSTVKVNYATSPYQTNMTGIDSIINELRIDIVNGFKGIAALSNILNSTTETHGNLQVDYYVTAIQSMQNELAGVLKFFFDSGNQVQGISSDLTFAFKRQRAYDRVQFAEFIKTETDTILAKLAAGVISVAEAREEIDNLRDELVVS